MNNYEQENIQRLLSDVQIGRQYHFPNPPYYGRDSEMAVIILNMRDKKQSRLYEILLEIVDDKEKTQARINAREWE